MHVFITCEDENGEEENGVEVFCAMYERYKEKFSLEDFIALVNDYSRYDSMENFSSYMKAVYRM